MLKGKQVRITFKDKIEDDCEPSGWWSQELWKYNEITHLFECYYPISTYDLSMHTDFDEDDTNDWMYTYFDEQQALDSGTVKSIKVEDNSDFYNKNGKTLKELAVEKIQTMEDEEIIRRLFK